MAPKMGRGGMVLRRRRSIPAEKKRTKETIFSQKNK